MITNLNDIWSRGFNKIIGESDYKREQELWVKEASEEIRKIPKEELYKRQFIYIPNDNYMIKFFGGEIVDYKYGIYRGEQCSLYKRLVFPIRGFNSDVAGLGGWANDSQWKYTYSPESCWDKSRYFYIQPDEFEQALTDDYLILVDGIFDSINLNSYNAHSASLMGSYLSKWHKYYLKMFKYIIVIPDNDNAGVQFVKSLKRYRDDVIVIKQGKKKDIDEYLIQFGSDSIVDVLKDLHTSQVMQKIIL